MFKYLFRMVIILALFYSQFALSWQVLNPYSTWVVPQVEFDFEAGGQWAEDFQVALDRWNSIIPKDSKLQRLVQSSGSQNGSRANYCDPNYVATKTVTVVWSTRTCYGDLGKSALAVAPSHSRNGVRYNGAIIFNSNFQYWNAYDGSYLETKEGEYYWDFRRIALHEIGHILGLDHELAMKSILQPSTGSVYDVQPDDVRGFEALYTSKVPPSSPSFTSVSQGGAQQVGVSLAWSSVQYVSQYELYRCDGSNSSLAACERNVVEGLSFKESGMPNSKAYYYKLRACNRRGCSPVKTAKAVSGDLALAMSMIVNFLLADD